MKKITKSVTFFVLSCFIAIAASGCTTQNDELYKVNVYTEFIDSNVTRFAAEQSEMASHKHTTASIKTEKKSAYESFSLSDVPKYTGEAYAVINDNVPFFSKSELSVKSFEKYSEFDDLGRCGTAYACIGKDIMPTEERGKIGSVKPTGWHTVKYDNVDGKIGRAHV